MRSGQLLNIADIARDLGISANNAKNWLSVLEASYLVIILRPYFENAGKRLVKAPKVHFTDTGTLCYLTGNHTPETAATGPMAGAIFETAVVTELYKRFLHRGMMPRIYFWRTSLGTEVDVLIDRGSDLIPLEIKSSATPRPEMASGINSLFKTFPDRIKRGYIIYPGDMRLPVAPNITAVPFGEV